MVSLLPLFQTRRRAVAFSKALCLALLALRHRRLMPRMLAEQMAQAKHAILLQPHMHRWGRNRCRLKHWQLTQLRAVVRHRIHLHSP